MQEIKEIIKRDGRKVEFDKEKIVNAIFKAAVAVGGHNRKTAEVLAGKVTKAAEKQFEGKIPTVEQLQDLIEKTLIEEGHAKTAKAYILYREQRAKIRDMKNVALDIEATISDYLDQSDWRVKENSNEQYSFSGLLLYVAGKVIANYMLNKVYMPDIAEAHKKGYVHIHDLSHGVIAYCAGWSIRKLLERGFGGVPNKVEAKPAKHLGVVIHQMVNYIGCLQMEFAGAQAFSSVDTYLAPFIRADNLSYKEVKQEMQKLIFSLNIPSRWGSQYPFSNLTFDLTVPEDLKNEKAIVGGKEQDYTYGDCQKEMDMINNGFIEVMLEGDAKGAIFTFPIPTYNLTKEFNWDSEIANLLFEMTAKYGTPYFQNYIGSGLSPKSIRAMCLHPEEEILIRKNGNIEKTTMGKLAAVYSSGFDSEGWSKPKEQIEALSLNRGLKLEWKQINNIVKTKSREMITIKSRDGKEIKVTPNHPVSVLAPEGIKEKPAAAVSHGEYLLSMKAVEECLSQETQKIGQDVLDKEMAKLLGFFVADGNYLFENRKNMAAFGKEKGLQFTFPSKNNDYSKEIISIAEKKLGTKAKTKKDPRYNVFYAYFYNAKKARELSNAGLKKHGGVPPQIWSSPKQIIEAFLEGFFLGDGYEKRGEIHINDEALARELVLLYHLTGKPVTFRERKNSQVITIQQGKEERSDGLLGNPPLCNRVPSWGVNTGKVPGLTHNRNVGLMTLQYYDAHTKQTKQLAESNIYPIEITAIEKNEFHEENDFYDIELVENHRFVHSLGTITHNCCRLNMDMNQLIQRPGHTFAMGDATGSIGVVTLNLNRLGYEAKNKEEFFAKIKYYMTLAKESLEVKRKIINNNLKNGLMPYTRVYLGTFRNHFSTIGLCGMNEACLNLLGKDILSDEGKQLTMETLTTMREMTRQFQVETGNLYNLEATPAEGASYRLAKLDKETYPDIITAGKKAPYLTNSTQIPVDATDDVIEALEHQNDIQPLYTGGTVFHTFLGEKMSSGEAAKKLVKKIAYNMRIPYFTLTPTFSLCPEHGYVTGEHFNCPHAKKTEAAEARQV